MHNTKMAALFLWIALPCLLGFGSMIMKNQVQNLEKQLNIINTNIREDIKTIHILKAEWSHLNNPSRLKKLASKHISLNPLQPEQIINYSELPFEYESNESRKVLARKNLNKYAQKNKELKKLVKAQR